MLKYAWKRKRFNCKNEIKLKFWQI